MNTNMNTEMVNILRVEGIMAQGYGINPKIVMRDKRLTPEAKCIYSYFASFAGNGNQAFPSRDVILDELQMSKDRYYRHLKILLKADYIRIEQLRGEGGFFKRNIYTIVTNPNPDEKGLDGEEKGATQKTVQKKGKTAGKKGVIVKSIETCKKLKQKNTGQSGKSAEEEIFIASTKSKSEELRERLQIESMKETDPQHARLIEEIFMAVEDMDLSEQISIGGNIKNKEAIQSLLNRLTTENIRLVTNTLANNKKTLTNRKKYIQACLANSIFDINKNNEEAEKILQQRKLATEEQKKAEQAEINREKLNNLYPQYPELKKMDEEITALMKEKSRAILSKAIEVIQSIDTRYNELKLQRENFIKINALDVLC